MVVEVTLVVAITVTVVLVAAVVVVVTVAGRALVCAGAVIDTFVEVVLTIGMRVGVLIIVSNVAADLLMGALDDITRDVLTNIDVDALVNVNGNLFAGVMTAFEFAVPGPLE